jgi:hypothetical protein
MVEGVVRHRLGTDAAHGPDPVVGLEQDDRQVDRERLDDLLDHHVGEVLLVQLARRAVEGPEQLLDRGGDLVEVGDPAGRAVPGRGAVHGNLPAVATEAPGRGQRPLGGQLGPRLAAAGRLQRLQQAQVPHPPPVSHQASPAETTSPSTAPMAALRIGLGWAGPSGTVADSRTVSARPTVREASSRVVSTCSDRFASRSCLALRADSST